MDDNKLLHPELDNIAHELRNTSDTASAKENYVKLAADLLIYLQKAAAKRKMIILLKITLDEWGKIITILLRLAQEEK